MHCHWSSIRWKSFLGSSHSVTMIIKSVVFRIELFIFKKDLIWDANCSPAILVYYNWIFIVAPAWSSTKEKYLLAIAAYLCVWLLVFHNWQCKKLFVKFQISNGRFFMFEEIKIFFFKIFFLGTKMSKLSWLLFLVFLISHTFFKLFGFESNVK